jgi:hypothetical protein
MGSEPHIASIGTGAGHLYVVKREVAATVRDLAT